ncbi:uncharacterized protein BDZ99DRAFT_422643 [Mytilinidion resinicola]|uniref:SCD domain-containing protein n=1 Tax=Mytilinidion resinicola TaxID=574789 RepID=A0A6A6YBP8_9PEZI|nr:uncharacterized protein BDZ99DRAFT_422643 [Mytilinidion resinicola]KAF2806241.1 hypothetical protein BDZ99DRAFT_422643 [Mytilinidion resinicola]
MPARNSSMELSSPDAEPSSTAAPRKSGRVVKKPELVAAASSPSGSVKRKRDGDDDEDMDDASDEASDEESDGEPDEEELREKKRAKKKAAPRKPAPKKSKTNGEVSLAIRPAVTKQKKPRKARTVKMVDPEEAEGLYAEVFASGDDLNDVAARWITSFNENEAIAVAEIVNLVLKCAGCDSKVDNHDIDDPDSCATKLTDIQEEYQANDITEYPLVARGKSSAAFKANLAAFFRSLIESIAQTSLLFDNVVLMENLQVWISTLSSASNRPFRHTATVSSLAIITALCHVGKEIVESEAKARRQSEAEAKKARVNRGRVQGLEARAHEMGQRKETVDGWLREMFDAVFIHRYRDVDPKIRVDCIEALSEWITTYPEAFFDSHHLRYLGWVLSDTHAPSRATVIKSLQRLFKDKDKQVGLRTFTERFRTRIVEMATSDAEATVRASTVELLDTLLEAEMLEPDDIDSVGRLIFDSEPRVRKAVVGFFVENINVVYEGRIDEMGGQETLDETLVRPEDDDDYDSPRLEWLKLKCLVSQLEAYDSEEGELPNQIEHIAGSHFALIAAGIESRFSLAAQSLYDHMPEIRQWEILAGYLLFDHSQPTENGSTTDASAMLQQNCKLTEREEIILLEILNAAVKISLANASEPSTDAHKKTAKGRLTKAQREELIANQEQAVRHLALLIPRLLKKFGAIPDAASSVLNLERVLNLDVFQELRQDATLAALLDDINKQFMTHGNERVLLEASEALRHARGYEELREITDGKVQLLWDDTMNAFATLTKGRDLSTRGSLSDNILTGVTNTVLRIANLASISDCVQIFESVPTTPKPKSKPKAAKTASADTDTTIPPITALISLITRGVPQPDTDLIAETSAAEDALAIHALRAVLPYYMWKISHWKTAILSSTPIPDTDVAAVAARFDDTKDALIQVMNSRKGADEIRVEAAGVICDLYCIFMVLRDAKRSRDDRKKTKVKGKAQENGTAVDADEGPEDWEALIKPIDPDVRKHLLNVFAATELAFAKRAGKKLDGKANEKDKELQKDAETDIDADPLSDDDPVDSDDEAEEVVEDVEGSSANAAAEKTQRALLAEKRLCEIGGKMVMAVLGGLLDDSRGTVRKRLERNRTKLGASWREVCAFLERAKKGRAVAGGAKQVAKAKLASPKKARSKAIVIDDDSSEDEIMVDSGDEDGEGEGAGDAEEEEAEREADVESVMGD